MNFLKIQQIMHKFNHQHSVFDGLILTRVSHKFMHYFCSESLANEIKDMDTVDIIIFSFKVGLDGREWHRINRDTISTRPLNEDELPIAILVRATLRAATDCWGAPSDGQY